jgi:hypothetical protein
MQHQRLSGSAGRTRVAADTARGAQMRTIDLFRRADADGSGDLSHGR